MLKLIHNPYGHHHHHPTSILTTPLAFFLLKNFLKTILQLIFWFLDAYYCMNCCEIWVLKSLFLKKNLNNFVNTNGNNDLKKKERSFELFITNSYPMTFFQQLIFFGKLFNFKTKFTGT